MQLTLLYLVYFVLKETDIHLKGQERKLVCTAKKTKLQDCLSIGSILLFQRQVQRQISKHRYS